MGLDRSDGRIPRMRAVQVDDDRIVVDGKLTESIWSRTGASGPFVSPNTGRQATGSALGASARVAWSKNHFYVAFSVNDPAPESPFARTDRDPHIWSAASGVEVMVQPGTFDDNRAYFEIQVDVNGAVWDTWFEDYNQPRVRRSGRVIYGHQQWTAGLRRAVQRSDDGYTVEMALPWAGLAWIKKQRPAVSLPPRRGDVWRVNLYVFRDGQRKAVAWSPILGQGNFHRTARFGKVEFGGGKSGDMEEARKVSK
jgi:hypothetical protein